MANNLTIGGQLGSYLIESVIGRGGMSVVYRAVHSRLGTPVALKALAPELSSDDAFRERFLREAKMAAGIDHPNVIPIYDTGLCEDSLYIIMRYVSGGDLKTELVTAGPLSPERAIELLKPVGRALDAAHAHGLVHRDVKPANILLQRSESGEIEHVYLSDFGVTKHATSVSGLTKTGALVGTVDYMAPEQIEGQTVSAQTDIYALGCLFYQSLTGRVPYHRETEAAVLWAHMRGDYEPLAGVRPGLSPALDATLSKALSKEPSARFARATVFVNAFSAAAGAGGGTRPSDLIAEPADATVAEAMPPPGPGPLGLDRSPDVTRPDHEQVAAASAPTPPPPPTPTPTPTPTPPPPAAPARPAQPRRPARSGGGGGGGLKRWWPAGAAVLGVAVIAGAVALLSGGSSSKDSKSTADSFPATLVGVPTNHVDATGDATVKLDGDSAAITVDTNGLLDSAPHAMHIHAGGEGKCPPAQAAHEHNGRLSISTVNGEPFYGPPVTSMTTKGDISKKSILAFPRYPHEGNIRYTRTITLPHKVAQDVRNRKASIIVHGIDYNGNGLYDSVLDRSELDRHLPGEATAPGLCGPLRAASTQKASAGGSRIYTASLTVQKTDYAWICSIAAGPAAGQKPPAAGA